MSSPNPISSLGKSAIDAVVALFLSVLTRPLRQDHVRFTLNASTSELVITSLNETEAGEVGLYYGEKRWPYLKANLNLVLPHPLVVELAYPMNYRQLRAHLLTRYEMVIEQEEFALTAGGVGLKDEDTINKPLVDAYGHLTLYATNKSGRFIAGSSMTLLFIQPNTRVPLNGLFDLRGVLKLDKLVNVSG